ncbi:shieldin complex subunit 1 isoform X4 [Kogia breviceps]|uniref:shieldin complex subunit 1 isoform X4 n=1 Tax=Kogia breviceps TaxID=27615 RepID=UPI0034D15D2A
MWSAFQGRARWSQVKSRSRFSTDAGHLKLTVELQPAASEAAGRELPFSLFAQLLVFSFGLGPASAYTSNLNTEQNDSWTSENSWLDPSVKGPPETKAEDAGLRKSLDKFYEVFGHPQPASGNSLSTSVYQCLSQKINELKGKENENYTLRSFQMARVIFNRDGCSILQKHSRDAHFYPTREGSASLEDEKLTPGLSKEIIHFLLQQNLMKDP